MRDRSLYSTHRDAIVLESALKTLCKALLYIGKAFCNAEVDENTNITIQFEDGFVIDDVAARMNDLQEMRDGIMQKWEYRAKWYGETEEEAKAKINDMQTATANPFSFA